jgi:hypothetical protein
MESDMVDRDILEELRLDATEITGLMEPGVMGTKRCNVWTHHKVPAMCIIATMPGHLTLSGRGMHTPVMFCTFHNLDDAVSAMFELHARGYSPIEDKPGTYVDLTIEDAEKHLTQCATVAAEHGCCPEYARMDVDHLVTTGTLSPDVGNMLLLSMMALRQLMQRVKAEAGAHASH